MGRLGNFVYRWAKLIIILVAILNLVALASFIRFKLDTDFLSFFTSGNPRAQQYELLNDKYQTGEIISVFIEQDGYLLEKANLQKAFRLQQAIESVPGVRRVESFIPSEIPLGQRTVAVDAKFIGRHADILEDFIETKYLYTDRFLSADKSRAVLVVSLEVDAAAGEVLASLKDIVQNEAGWTVSLAGNEVIKDTIWNYLIRVLCIIPPIAVCLILSVFYLFLRNFRLTVLAMIPAGIGALWTFATIFWSGHELNLVTAITPIFVLVMGAADGLHYTTHFQDNMGRYADRRQLTVETLRMVGMPIFLTSITTMAGFASLIWTDVLPMRHMGIFVALGIGYAGILSLFFMPAVLSRVKLPARPPQTEQSRLTNLVVAASKQKVPVIAAFLAVVVISAVFIPQIKVVSNQLMFFKEGSEIRQTFNRVEEYFGGALPLTAEIVADKGIDTLRDYRYAEDVLDVERQLERLPGVESAVSLFDIVTGLNKMITGRDEYPENPHLIPNILRQIDDEDLETWVSDDGLKMVIRTEDLDSLDVAVLEDFAAEHADIIRVITGMPVLFDEMNRLVVKSQIRSLGLALVLIFIMLLVTIRKIRAALVAMLPIVITIVAILGMVTMTGFYLNVMTANLSAIAIGVGVDYSIHLISGIHFFRKRGLGWPEAVDAALNTVSRPILANAFGLAIGLSALFFSPLHIHLQAASVMWVAMVVSSLAALLLIPMFYSGLKSR